MSNEEEKFINIEVERMREIIESLRDVIEKTDMLPFSLSTYEVLKVAATIRANEIAQERNNLNRKS